jgi:hypothetical protein
LGSAGRKNSKPNIGIHGHAGGTRPGQTRKTPKNLCTCVSEEGGDEEGKSSETSSLLSYTLRYVSLTELGTLCRVGLRDPMHLCTYVSEEGGWGRGGCGLRSAISVVIHTWIRQSRGISHSVPGWVPRTDCQSRGLRKEGGLPGYVGR